MFREWLGLLKKTLLHVRDIVLLRTLRAYFRTRQTYRLLREFCDAPSERLQGVPCDPFPKIIWLLWLQGWDNAPWLVQQVARSWAIQNPGWKIELLTQENISRYAQIEYLDRGDIADQAKSDIIRLTLLDHYGGVWADATMLCMQPLDTWFEFAIQPSAFWMYHGRGRRMSILEGPASWFILSRPKSTIIRQWKEECDQFWKVRRPEYHYNWMDQLFRNLYYRKADFRDAWQRVPYIWCDLSTEAHCLNHGNDLISNTRRIKNRLLREPPFALKLAWKAWQEAFPDVDMAECRDSNGFAAIQAALMKAGSSAVA